MKRSKILIFIFISLITASFGHTETRKALKVSSKIDHIMVYHDRALVTRKTTLKNLQPGVYEIIFKNLPGLIQDDSVRAKFSRGENIKILDVEVKGYQLEKTPDEPVRILQEKLQNLEDEKKGIENKLHVLGLEREYLNGAKSSFLQIPAPSGTGTKTEIHTERPGVKEYDAMLSYLSKKYYANAQAAHIEEIKLRDINNKISIARSKLNKLNVGSSGISKKKKVKVTVEVLKGDTYTLNISYINSSVKWNPGYDIRVNMDEEKTEFIGYGVVSQSSGEDWMNAFVSFSTAQPAVRGWLPDLIPLYATLADKIQSPGRKKQGGKSFPTQQAANRAMLDNVIVNDNDQEDNEPKEYDETETAVVKTDRRLGSLVFSVPKRTDIPADGSPHRTAISRQVFPVRFEYISIPKLSPYAFLQAIGSNKMKTPILRGGLNIFIGNDFVGSSYTDNILPGEDFELTLSVNENIRVTRSLEEKEEKKAGFLGSTKTINYSFLIKIENYSGKDIVMNLLDQVPVSDSEDIEIENVSFSHKPAIKTKKGIVKWQFKMKPKEIIKLTFSFTVIMPKDKDTAFFRTQLPPSVYLQQLPRMNEKNTEGEYYNKEMQKNAPAMKMKMY